MYIESTKAHSNMQRRLQVDIRFTKSWLLIWHTLSAIELARASIVIDLVIVLREELIMIKSCDYIK